MPSFQTTQIVPFTAQQMFDLVADVEAYPQFLPLCEALHVREHRTDAEGHPQVVADMTCGYKAIRETFTSQVTLVAAKREILVEYIDGPFSHLHNQWRFEQSPGTYAPGGSAIHFRIDYAFKSPMLGLLVGAMFDRAFRRFLVAFEERAGEVYGGGQDIAAAHPATI
ncbi:MAG: coenzyme Q-binding protein COQ10 [Hyphomicrobiaceae bacterium]|jgi:coenzyme Q-binding protein COQ10